MHVEEVEEIGSTQAAEPDAARVTPTGELLAAGALPMVVDP